MPDHAAVRIAWRLFIYLKNYPPRDFVRCVYVIKKAKNLHLHEKKTKLLSLCQKRLAQRYALTQFTEPYCNCKFVLIKRCAFSTTLS